jgi:hypothetical protein
VIIRFGKPFWWKTLPNFREKPLFGGKLPRIYAVFHDFHQVFHNPLLCKRTKIRIPICIFCRQTVCAILFCCFSLKNFTILCRLPVDKRRFLLYNMILDANEA